MAKLSKAILETSSTSRDEEDANVVSTLEMLSKEFGTDYLNLGHQVFKEYIWQDTGLNSLKSLLAYRSTFVCFLAAMSHADLKAFLQTFTETKLK